MMRINKIRIAGIIFSDDQTLRNFQLVFQAMAKLNYY